MNRIAALASLIAMGAFTPRQLSRAERRNPPLPSPAERAREDRDHARH